MIKDNKIEGVSGANKQHIELYILVIGTHHNSQYFQGLKISNNGSPGTFKIIFRGQRNES